MYGCVRARVRVCMCVHARVCLQMCAFVSVCIGARGPGSRSPGDQVAAKRRGEAGRMHVLGPQDTDGNDRSRKKCCWEEGANAGHGTGGKGESEAGEQDAPEPGYFFTRVFLFVCLSYFVCFFFTQIVGNKRLPEIEERERRLIMEFNPNRNNSFIVIIIFLHLLLFVLLLFILSCCLQSSPAKGESATDGEDADHDCRASHVTSRVLGGSQAPVG